MNLEQLKEWQRSGHESLSAQMMPETINAENRTVDIVWFTGIDVPRMNLWTGESYMLRFDPKGVDLSRLNAGAPVLDNHNHESGVAGQMGVVEKAWVDGTNYKATLRFSKRPEVDGIWRDIQDKILQKFSMGTEVPELQDITQKGAKNKTILATKWRPNEISMTNIPADFGTTTLSAIEQVIDPASAVEELALGAPAQPNKENEINMSEQLNDNVAGAPAAVIGFAAPLVVDETKLQAVRQAEKLRAKEIRSRVSAANLSVTLANELIEADASVELASDRIFSEMAKVTAVEAPTNGHHSAAITHDKGDKLRETMSAYMLCRYEPVRYKDQEEAAREWTGFSLREIARECVAFKGVSVRGKGIDEVVQLAISTSDLPNILIDVANKTLRAGYENYPNTFQSFTKRGTATDFKTIYRTQLSGAPNLVKVNENGEIQQGLLTDGKESFSLATYARILSISRKTIINDDLSALTRVPELMGRKAAILEGDIVWALVTANAAMSDGVALFHGTHGNLGTTAAIGVDTIGELQSKMTLQTGLEGDKLNLNPRYIAAPIALRLSVQKLYAAIYPATSSATVPSVITALEPIFEPRLDSNSITAFYVFADPGSVDTIEYCFLEGQEGMYFETQMGFEVDGIRFKARHDFGAGVIDYRGMAKNIGA